MNRRSLSCLCILILGVLAATYIVFSGGARRGAGAPDASQYPKASAAEGAGTKAAGVRPSSALVISRSPVAKAPATSAAKGSSASDMAAVAAPKVSGAYADLPLGFEPNRGQTDSRVQYLARGKGYNLFLTPNESVLSLRHVVAAPADSSAKLLLPRDPRHAPVKYEQNVLRFQLEGGAAAPRTESVEKLPGVTNYYIGNDPKKWQTGVPNYRKVVYREAYPGIDVSYYGNPGQLESDYVVAPGADAGAIRLRVSGAEKMRIDGAGDLILATSGGDVRMHKPVAYQMVAGARREVTGAYEIDAKTVRFEVGAYDQTAPLVIDPTLTYSTYLGGTASDQANSVAVDSTGEAYIAGGSLSIDFPLQSSHQDANAGSGDAFVSKFSADGSSLIFSTFLGGGGADSASGIAVDGSGSAYVAGQTASQDFPTQDPLPGQNAFSGASCGFVSEFASNGALSFSTYLCGGAADTALGVAVDKTKNIYVVGATESVNFPLKNPVQSELGGTADAFVTKLAAVTGNGSSILFSSFFGGNSLDEGTAIALDANNHVYIDGITNSTNFPTTNPIQATLGGATALNGFVTEFDLSGTPLVVYSTYLGGSQEDELFGIAADGAGNAYVTGVARSADFPLKNSLQAGDSGGDAIVAKIAPSGASLVFSTLFGGGGESATGIALDSSNNVYITGSTSSTDLPTRLPIQATNNGDGQACFATELKADGSDYIFSTYLGGSNSNFNGGTCAGVSIDSNNNIYLAGSSATFDYPTVAPFQATEKSLTSTNATLSKISPATPAGPQMYPSSLNFGSVLKGTASQPQYVSLLAGTNAVTISSVVISGPNAADFTDFTTCGESVPATVVCNFAITFSPTTSAAESATVTVNEGTGTQIFTIAGTGGSNTPPPNGSITVAPGSLTFGNQEVSTSSAAQTVTVTVTGTNPVSLDFPSATGADPGDFSYGGGGANPCPLESPIVAGTKCQVGFVFTPTATGARSATMQITGNFTTQTVAVSGTGTPQIAQLTPPDLAFPNTVVGVTSATMTATLTNISNSTNLTNISPTISAPFVIVSTTCPTGGQVTPGQSCTFSIAFAPTAAGFAFSELTVTSNDPVTQSVELFGTGLNRTATLAPIQPNSIQFGRQTVGVTSNQQGAFLQNTGNTALTFTTPISGANSGDFAVTNTCAGTIPAAGSCEVEATFTPGATGARFATITVQSSAIGAPQTILVSGTGTGATTATLLPSPINFGAIAMGQSSAPQSAFFNNTGTTALTITDLEITGADPSDFAVSYSQPGLVFSSVCTEEVLNAQAACAIPIVFTPTAGGTRTATLTITDTTAAKTHSIQLNGSSSGTVTPSLNITKSHTGNFAQGQTSATYTVTVSNQAGTAATSGTVTMTESAPSGLTVTAMSGTGWTCTTTTCTRTDALQPGSSYPAITVTVSVAANATSPQINAVSVSGGGSTTANTTDSTNITSTTPGTTFAPTSLTFASQALNTSSAAQAIKLTNSGSGALTISGITITGTNAGDYSQTNTCPASLAAAANCSISVVFKPTATGTRTANVSVADNAAGSPQTVGLTGTGAAAAAPIATFAPTSLTFASQTVGTTSAAQAITLTNTGNAALTISGISLTGANTGDFAQTNTCPASLAANANCSISVTFKPTAAGTRAANVSVADNAAGSPQTVGLTGTGAAAVPGITFAPTSLTFASQTLNTSSAAQTITLTNSGTGALTISGVSLTGANPGDYSQTNTCPASLAANANCTISVVFKPTATGTRTANVSVADNATGSPQTVGLTGTGTTAAAPAATFAPTSLTFASQTVGTTSGAQAITLTNTGNAALTISGVSLTGANAGDYAQTNTCPASLAANANCTISVTFKPTAAGARAANVSVADNATGSPQLVPLNGTGAAATPVITFAPTSLTFASTAIGQTTAAQTITLTNSGTAVLTISGVSLTGANPGDFAQTNTCPASLAANANCTISVTFKPTATGARGANVSVADNATGSPQVVAVSGTGAAANAPIATFAPTSLTFASTTIGQTTAAQAITLTNTGNAALTISGVSLTGANPGDYAQTNTCPASLAANANCSISVTFKPTAAGARTASVSVADNATGSPQTVGLSGTGAAATPTVTFAPTSLTFASTTIGQTTAAQTITLTNSGTAALTISGVSLTGANPGDFAQTNTCPASLAANANCTISVTFKPTAAGARGANVSVADNATGSPQTAALNGTGAAAPAPVVTITPASLTFASTVVGQTSAAQTVTVKNTGNAVLTFNNINLGGTNPGDFGANVGCDETLAAGASCTISVTFAPTTTGARAAAISIQDNAANSPQSVPLNGTGASATPTVTVTPGSLAFGSQTLNTTTAAQNVTVKNTGTSTVTFTSFSITGENSGDFALSNGSCNPSGTLAAGASCTVGATFTPTAAGARSATLAIADNATGSPQNVSLGGTGAAPAVTITVPPGGSTTATSVPGGTAYYGLVITSAPGVTGTVTLGCTPSSPLLTCTVIPSTVVLNGGTTEVAFGIQTYCQGATNTGTAFPFGGSGGAGSKLGAELLMMLFAGLFGFAAWTSRKNPRVALTFATLVLVALGSAGCGGGLAKGPSGATPAGTYTLTLTSTLNGQTQTLPNFLTLIVK